jgi:hypothetical protein
MTKKSTHAARRRRAGYVGVGAAVAAAGLAIAGPAEAAPPLSAEVADDTLTVTGSSANDAIALRLAAGAAGTLLVDFGDDGIAEHTLDRSTFSRIDVFMKSGNDSFRVDQVNGAFADETLTVDGGSGNDTMNGGDGRELFIGSSGSDAVDGNRGDDTGELGSGDDSFRWDPGDGSDIVEGATGFDTLDFNGANVAEQMTLSPLGGGRALFFRDIANIRMDMDNIERLDVTALGGIDTVTVADMTGTDFRQADVDLAAAGGAADGAADIVTVTGTAGADRVSVGAAGARVDVDGLKTSVNLIGSEVADRLQVNTLDGNDDVQVAAAVNALITVAVDLGAGE